MSHIQGLPPLPKCFDGLVSTHRTISESSQGEVQEGETHVLLRDNKELEEETLNHETLLEERSDNPPATELPTDNATPFSKLNHTYEKLKSEMVNCPPMQSYADVRHFV